MNEDYSAQIIYKPPVISTEKNEFEFPFFKPIRFIQINENSKTTECLDCDAKSLAFSLEGMEFDCPKLSKIKEALLFILWNTDWPVGD